MIFAAGLGARLMPLTANKPKALVELAGKTLLQRCVDKLIASGITSIIINIHHFPQLMRNAIAKLDCGDAEIIISDESQLLLDTGGGLLHAARHLKDSGPVLLHNVDIVSSVNLRQMAGQHKISGALATLAVSDRSTTRYFLWHNSRLCGWQNRSTGQEVRCFPTQVSPEPLAFSGIHIIDPSIFDLMTETDVFPINKVYLRLAADHKIMAYRHDPTLWADAGTTGKLQTAEKMILSNPKIFEGQ